MRVAKIRWVRTRKAIMDIQRVARGSAARTVARTIRHNAAAVLLQKTVRRGVKRVQYHRYRHSVVRLQVRLPAKQLRLFPTSTLAAVALD